MGSIAPFVVWLHQRSDRTLLPLARSVGLDLDFAKWIRGRHSFASLIDEARTIRGPRFTILDQLSTRQLEAEYQTYLRSLDVRAPYSASRFAAQ